MSLSLASEARWNGCVESSDLKDSRTALIVEVLRRDSFSRQVVRMRVTGESMLPILWPGDEVGIVSCSLQEVGRGEIVLAERHGNFYLHRLIRSSEDGFVLRGDSMPAEDTQFPREALLGKLITVGESEHSRAKYSNFRQKFLRVIGLLLCHSGFLRRFALRLHQAAKRTEFCELEDLG